MTYQEALETLLAEGGGIYREGWPDDESLVIGLEDLDAEDWTHIQSDVEEEEPEEEPEDEIDED